MTMSLRKMVLVGAVLVSLMAVTRAARAEFICSLEFNWRPRTFNKFTGEEKNYGTYGQIEVTLYSAPNCTGSYVTYVSLCSSGASSNTASYCDPIRLLSSSQILSVFDTLQRAASTQQRVDIYRDANSTSPYAGQTITFSSRLQ